MRKSGTGAVAVRTADYLEDGLRLLTPRSGRRSFCGMSKGCRRKKWRGEWIARKLRFAPISPTPGPSFAGIWNRGSNEAPHEATLALYAGQDLGPFARWRTARHLAGCPRCRGEVTGFSALRQEITNSNELPGIAWNQLAAEMKANIRVGLAAGECIRSTQRFPHPLFAGLRPAIACASMAALLVAGLSLERPAPTRVVADRQPGISLRATPAGVEVRQGEQAFVLQNGPTEDVTYRRRPGSMGARFVDPGTGYVTINTVYVQ